MRFRSDRDDTEVELVTDGSDSDKPAATVGLGKLVEMDDND